MSNLPQNLHSKVGLWLITSAAPGAATQSWPRSLWWRRNHFHLDPGGSSSSGSGVPCNAQSAEEKGDHQVQKKEWLNLLTYTAPSCGEGRMTNTQGLCVANHSEGVRLAFKL